MNLIERSIDPRPTASHVPICERQRHTEKACQRIVMCRRERAWSGYFPIAWREANCSTRRDSSPVAACPARRLWSRPYAVRSHISFTGRTASNSLRRAGAVGCLQHDRAAAALPTSRRAQGATPATGGPSAPGDERLATVDQQPHFRAHRQRHLGRDMTERKSGQDRRAGCGADAREHRCQRVAAVVR